MTMHALRVNKRSYLTHLLKMRCSWQMRRGASCKKKGLTRMKLIPIGGTPPPLLAVLIDSTVLGAPIWFALRNGWEPKPADGIPIFYASELPLLREKTSDELRAIYKVKKAFNGGFVRT